MNVIGIRTHNLKNLSFDSSGNELVGICGVSGGGKTSFAHSTLYGLCSDVFESLSNGYSETKDYVVSNYSELFPAISLRQNCFNINPHSTIYSFLNISSLLSRIQNHIPYENLKLNKPSNFCLECNGEGKVYQLSYEKIVDENQILESIPFIPWKDKEEYQEAFLLFCQEHSISLKKRFNELDEQEREKILYGGGDKIFDVKFKYKGRKRVRHLKYPGIINYLKDELIRCKVSKQSAVKYYVQETCSKCLGSRVDFNKYQNFYIGGLCFRDFLIKPIDQILIQIVENEAEYALIALLKSISKMGLGYLSLSRSIPSLSGGELQKLKFSMLCNGSISNLLIVLDEVSSGIHWSDYERIMEEISSIKKNNLILMIEHNHYFLSRCDRIITIGPKAGKHGGCFVELPSLDQKIYIKNKEENGIEKTILIEKIQNNNVHCLDLRLPIGKLTALVGKSGSGKTSIAKYIGEKLENTIFVTQKSLRGNIRSTVASYLKINKTIADFLGKKYFKDYSDFLPTSDTVGCSVCKGLGVIRYNRGFEESLEVICPECDGMLYSKHAENFDIDGLNLRELYSLEINDLSQIKSCRKIKKMFEYAKYLSLGHLSLCRKVQTLSGGEAKRLRILEALLNSSLKDKILIIDEPGSGLDYETCKTLIDFLHKIKKQCLSLMIIEHNPNIFLYADYIVEIGPESGEKGGKIVFEGNIKAFLKKNKCILDITNVELM